MNASVVSDLQSAILQNDPDQVRKILDVHTNNLKERPSCPKDGWSPLHFLAKSGKHCFGSVINDGKHVIRKPRYISEAPQAWEVSKTYDKNRTITTQENLNCLVPFGGSSTIASSPTSNCSPDLLIKSKEAASIPPRPPWAWESDLQLERYHRARMAIVYMLCDSGIDVNGLDASGLTPLHYAARRGDAVVCEVLLQCGADLFAHHDGIALWDEVETLAKHEKDQHLLLLHQINQNLVICEDSSALCETVDSSEAGEVDSRDEGIRDDEEGSADYGNGVVNKGISRRASHSLQYKEQCHQYQGHINQPQYHSSLFINDPDSCFPAEDKDYDDPENPPIGPSGAVRRVFRFYWPGMWRAVATQNISKVRQLVNSWCRVDLSRGGMTLRELAVGTGNEAVISLILSIQPSMSLVHRALAGNLGAVKELLDSPSRKKINIDIKKLSERGAPLLYFLIQSSQCQLIRELRRHGASLYTQMLDHSMQVDIPVIFTALEPWMDPEVVKSLLPEESSREARLLERVWNRGKNILWVAVENAMHIDAIEAIIKVGRAAVLCERDPNGLTVVDLALQNGQQDLVALMDRFVALWLKRPDLFPRQRDLLALRGFGRLEVVAEAQDKLDQDVGLFLQEYRRSQVVLQQMFQAVEDGETARMQQLLNFESDIFYLVDLLWQGRLEGDGMPLLHWAVLHGREQIVNLILRAPTDYPAAHGNNVTSRFCPDDVRDQWRRTPLHYACGLPEGANIIASLLDLGSSEHTLDMDGREPLDFQDARGSRPLTQFLDNIRSKMYDPNCPNPWDPDTLRLHLDNLRRERFQNHQQHPHFYSHAHVHSHASLNFANACSSLSGCPPYPFQSSHAHSRDMGISGWTYPAHFPTSPGSNFHWPLPHPSRYYSDEKSKQRLCRIM
ncbi:hypothetical protein SK128_022162 [Halocaridina rubra]|uniref:Uncharacterized protein n=1 Tax=Halocaridina rubra TaxID=373956 RepID=A0AAN8ZZ80_HALRR